MNFNKYTTQELEFIISNFGDLKRELEKRYIKESDDFIFTPGDVIYSKHGNDNSLLKIKKIFKYFRIFYLNIFIPFSFNIMPLINISVK